MSIFYSKKFRLLFQGIACQLSTALNRPVWLAMSALIVLHLSGSTDVLAQDKFYTAFQNGGAGMLGSIGHFDVTSSSWTADYHFETAYPGANPYGGVVEVNGKYYGVTPSGGAENYGVLFEYDPANPNDPYSVKVDFSPSKGAYTPYGSLVYLDGKLYGMASSSIFEYDPVSNNFINKVNLGVIGASSAYGSLTYHEGKFYGMTYYGGAYDAERKSYAGLIFEWDPVSNGLRKRHEFNFVDGANPYIGSALTYYDGKFYGITSRGGTNDYGVMFQWDPATDEYEKIIDFNGLNGWNPTGKLLVYQDKLYGMTTNGGSTHSSSNSGYGVLFEWDPHTETYTKKFEFSNYSVDGAYPFGSLVSHNDKLYGGTNSGGRWGYGVLFEFDPQTDLYSKRVDLSAESGATAGVLFFHGDDFYGLGQRGGSSQAGVFFKWNPETNVYTKLLTFNENLKGLHPRGQLSDIGNGKLYGFTLQGGPNNVPAIFEFDLSTKELTRKLDIPYGATMQYKRGKFYGSSNYEIFEWDPETNAYSRKRSLNSADGYYIASPMTYYEGKFYGTTVYGGYLNGAVTSYGVIFEWDPETNVYTKRHDFDLVNGANPYAALTFYNGKFYGTTQRGGAHDLGVLYEWDPVTGDYLKIGEFNGENGAYSYTALISFNDKLYGMTASGGSGFSTTNYRYGVIFEYDPSLKAFAKKIDFNGQNGTNPSFNSFASLNNKLYGMTAYGGNYGQGVYFEYDPVANILTKKLDLTRQITAGAYDAHLLSVTDKQTQSITFDNLEGVIYGSADVALSAHSTSGLPVGFSSSNQSVAKVAGSAVQITGAGTAVIRAYQDGNDDTYPASAVEVTLWVDKAPLTVTADDKERIYGQPNPLLTVSYSGFKNGEDLSAIPSKPVAVTSATSFSNVGNYDIRVQGGSSPNYSFVYKPGSLTISKASLTVTAPNLSKTYGSVNPTLMPSYSGFRNGDDRFDITEPSISTTATQFSDAGAYVISLKGGSATNYALTLVDGLLTIGKAKLTARADDIARYYHEDNPKFTITYSGFRGTDNIAVLDGLAMASTLATIDSDAGQYKIQVTGGEDNNYDFERIAGTLTIKKIPQTILFDPLSDKTIDDPPFDLTAISTSGLSVKYSSSDPLVATVADGQVTIVGPGTTVVTASQPGNINYLPAKDVTQSLVVTARKQQTITFHSFPEHVFAGTSIPLDAFSDSGLELQFTVSQPDIAEIINGNTLRLLKGGEVKITASQAGNDDYFPAVDVAQTILVKSIEIQQLNELYCAGQRFEIPFSVTGVFEERNEFIAEISGPDGEFNDPVAIGSTWGATSGTILCTMPDDLPETGSYLIRIRSTSPAGIGSAYHTPFELDPVPVITSIKAVLDPQPVTQAISVTVSFDDNALSAATLDWGDGLKTAGTIGGSSITGSHSYSMPGVYTLEVTVADACNNKATEKFQYIVIYDPSAGFVTGGGWYTSPAGAYVANPNATGKASFGFVAKYKKGSTVPDGNTDFRFQAGDLKFKSTAYEWLVIAGYKAMYKGVGELNGTAGYGFLISGVDGAKKSYASPDKFRIKIWDAAGITVYDNQMESADDAEANTMLGGGSIVIHDGKTTAPGTSTDNSNASEVRDAGATAEAEGATAYPNPFSQYITLVVNSVTQDDFHFQLIDATGKLVYDKDHLFDQRGVYSLDLSKDDLPTGLYLLKINQGRSVQYSRMMKK